MSAADPQRPAQSAPPTPKSGRNGRGQFAPGNPGGPGRPPKVQYIEREIVAIMASALTAEVWLEIVQAVVQKAKAGNMTAVQWLSRTFLSGKLNEAAAAQVVKLPPHIEMYELGRAQHYEWKRYLDKRWEETQDMGLDWPAADAAEEEPADEEVAADAAPAGQEEPLEDTPAPPDP